MTGYSFFVAIINANSANRLTAFIRGDNDPANVYCDPTSTTLTDVTKVKEWDLDGLGNWETFVSKVNDTVGTETFTLNEFNEYTSGSTRIHDKNGNLLINGVSFGD